ncbi:hypothetical protein ALP94_05660 [Pseudomonas savastanoi pv. glycinea]|nr:hypothetical protein ALP94_05660 [Pseudomonas savastanoi pv. glycinea]
MRRFGEQCQAGIATAENHQLGGGLSEVGNAVVRYKTTGLGSQQVHGSVRERSAQLGFKCRSVELLTDQHQMSGTLFISTPGAVEVFVEARAHTLNQQAHRFASDGGKTLDPQDAVLHDQLGQRGEQLGFFGLRKLDRNGVERVMVVVIMIIAFVVIVMGLAAIDMLLGFSTQTQQDIDRQTTAAGFDDLDRRRQLFGDFSAHRSQTGRVDHVGLVEDDQIGAGQLIGEQLMQWRFMIQVRIKLALSIDLIRECSKCTCKYCRAVDDGNHRIDGAGVTNFWPLEGLYQWFWQGQTRCFDEDVIQIATTRNQFTHDREELFLHGATKTAVGQLINATNRLFFGATNGALFEDFAVDAQLAELIDDNRNAPTFRVIQHVAQQGGFARTEEAGNDSDGKFGQCFHRMPFGNTAGKRDENPV